MANDKEATGVPSAGEMDSPNDDILGPTGGQHHWKQSRITDPSLDERGSVFFAALEMTRMPMILTDPNKDDNPIVFANNAFLDLTGYDLEEIIGHNCRFLQGAQTDRDAVAQLRDSIAARRAISLEILNYRKNGQPFWNGVFIGPVYGEDGALLYFFASQLDVTARKEAEATRFQSQKMESVGQLTAGLAHDFNNLLQVLSGSLDMMAHRREDEKAFKRYHLAATQATERGTKLTAQLLSFARRSRLEPRRIELSGLVNSIAELLDSTVGSRALLQLNLRRRLPEIEADPNHLEMALINVVVNARDAVSNGGTIIISTGQETVDADNPVAGLPDGQYIVMKVEDDGTGMTPHTLQRAVEPFFTTKAKGAGTGLGLATAHGFALQSRGALRIDSNVGEGTSVQFFFPIPVDDERPLALEPDSNGFRPEEVDRQSSKTVLIVEDEVVIAELAETTLTEAGYHVRVAHDYEQGLEAFHELMAAGGVALVFSDVLMPGSRNGLALAQEIRRIAPEVPVLLTTGYNDEMALQGPQPEALDVLGKPYRRNELVARVQAAIRRGGRNERSHQTSDFGHAQG
ncbi:hybrid sensor histidine kinase/response regulator [Sphingobium amiense]|uniref:histidine kinase n=1 Tax=Sphingobium amiense TaxID=135719 RepID=A0A494W913_9SPHN|nr:PAS domain-containing protein [Sphingobium amiense]BBD97140.1 hybrid sensor histidine kinase/response regulator [Sphingobium amiense]